MKRKSSKKIIIDILLIFLSMAIFWAARWYLDTYGNTGISSILFTLFSDLTGVESGLVQLYLLKSLLPAIGCTVVICVLLFVPFRKKTALKFKWYPFSKKLTGIIAIVLLVVSVVTTVCMMQIPQWVYGCLQKSTLYENYYVSPDAVEIAFPKDGQKRNLIYIVLESMETSYMSEEKGGGEKYNLIPNLTALAEDPSNINFSHNNTVGGWGEVTNTTWTVASLVAQSSGVPLSLPIDRNSYGEYASFLPGITTLYDILHDEGYYQTFMCGSEAAFGGRDKYYLQHSVDKVYDLNTAREDGIVPNDYFIWWGMEDKYLFQYAKQELTKIAKGDQPFSFTMLTVDTHFMDGYVCELCDDVYDEQYENVIACNDRQVAEFIQWIQKQDFYENTTVVVVGDHYCMDAQYFKEHMNGYDRHVYNCFINSAVSADNNKNRVFTPMDMLPTTLAAMGCNIEKNRLGLGTNLFSKQKTLAEEFGKEQYNQLLGESSDYYLHRFVANQTIW